MKKETVKKVVQTVGAFGTGAYCAIPAAFYSAIIKGWWPLKLSIYVATFGIAGGVYDKWVAPTLDEVVDYIMDDPATETVTE